MQTYYECRVKYAKEVDGQSKPITEVYLFDAQTYTEAEARANEEMASYISGEFQIASIRKAKYAELFQPEGGDRWYKVKVSFLLVDEKSGKEKRVSQTILMLASNIKDAYDKTIECMGGDTPDFEVNTIDETKIMDFFPYFSKNDDVKDREIGRRPATEAELSEARNNA